MQKVNVPLCPKPESDRLVKFFIMGDTSSGKTIITHSMTQTPITEHYKTTIGVEFGKRRIDYGNKKIVLQIWDSAGQERYRSIIFNFYRGSQIIFYMINLANQAHLFNVHNRMKEIRTHAPENAVIILVGNRPQNANLRQIEQDEIREITDQYCLTYIELNIFNHEEVRQLITIALSKLFTLEDDDQNLNIFDKKPLTLDQEIEIYLPACMKTYNTLTEYINLIFNLNTLIARSKMLSKNTSQCYFAKLSLMKNIFSHKNIFDNLEILPNLFMQYIDAIGGTLHLLNVPNDSMKSAHLSLLIRFFDRMNNNPHYQMAIIAEMDKFYLENPNQYFPCDNILQPIIICKLVGWMQNKPALYLFKAFFQLPYLGSIQLRFLTRIYGSNCTFSGSAYPNSQ